MKDKINTMLKNNFNRNRPWVPIKVIFIIAFLIVLAVGLIIHYYYGGQIDWKGIYIEATGMLLDIIFLGIIWAILEFRRSKKIEINRYKNEIDDFRKWKSEEAMYRIVGNIKRLNKLKFYDIDLSFCYLRNAELWNIRCSGNLSSANLRNAKLAGSDLRNISVFGKLSSMKV